MDFGKFTVLDSVPSVFFDLFPIHTGREDLIDYLKSFFTIAV